MKKHVAYILVFIACLLFQQPAKAQEVGNARISELQQKLADHEKDDTDKVKILNDLAYEYNKISPYDGIRYGIQSLSLAEELHWERGVARANSGLGANYFSLSNYPNAYKYWLSALKINEELGNKAGIANHLHNIGNIYSSQKNYVKALEYYDKALKIHEAIGNKQSASNTYTAIGNVYSQLKDYQKALEYQFHALALDEELHLKNNIGTDQINIGSVYNDEGNYTKATEELLQALQIKKESGDKNGLARGYNITGKVFLYIAKYISQNPNDHAYGSMNNNLEHAVTYLDSAITIDKEIGYLDNLQKSYEYLSEAHELLNDHKEALLNYKQYVAIKDSIFSLDKHTEIFNLEKKAEIEENNRNMEKAEEEKERREYLEMGGICTFIVIFISMILVLRHKRVNPRVIDILGTLSVLIIFEFIELLLHGQIEKLTHHSLVLTLLCLLLLAGIIIPVHHKIEHWMKKKIGHK